MRQDVLCLGAMVLIVGMLVSCGGAEGNGESDTAAATTESTTPGPSLVVELDDFYIEPDEIQGQVGQPLEITAFSEGLQTHTLTIDGLDVDRTFEPASTQIFNLTPAKAGQFKVHCRFHEAQGMSATFTVAE